MTYAPCLPLPTISINRCLWPPDCPLSVHTLITSCQVYSGPQNLIDTHLLLSVMTFFSAYLHSLLLTYLLTYPHFYRPVTPGTTNQYLVFQIWNTPPAPSTSARRPFRRCPSRASPARWRTLGATSPRSPAAQRLAYSDHDPGGERSLHTRTHSQSHSLAHNIKQQFC